MINPVNIIAVGSNSLIAAEVESIVRRIVGTQENICAEVSKDVTGAEDADLYVCAVTQGDVLAKKIPAEKLCILDLRPTAQFFIDISHIPAGETVYIFNSNQSYAVLLREMCREYKIHQLDFETIAYEDMSEREVIDKLSQAKYIIGVGKIVGREVLLSEKYRSYLREDVEIIGRTRMATMQTACFLMEKVKNATDKNFAQEISTLAEQLKNLSPTDDLYQKTVARMEKIIAAQRQRQNIHQHILDSLAAQLSDRLNANCSEVSTDFGMIDSLNEVVDKLHPSLNTNAFS